MNSIVVYLFSLAKILWLVCVAFTPQTNCTGLLGKGLHTVQLTAVLIKQNQTVKHIRISLIWSKQVWHESLLKDAFISDSECNASLQPCAPKVFCQINHVNWTKIKKTKCSLWRTSCLKTHCVTHQSLLHLLNRKKPASSPDTSVFSWFSHIKTAGSYMMHIKSVHWILQTSTRWAFVP